MALARYVDNPHRPASYRNHAIGMLANLSDNRALPFLEKYYTGCELSPQALVATSTRSVSTN